MIGWFHIPPRQGSFLSGRPTELTIEIGSVEASRID